MDNWKRSIVAGCALSIKHSSSVSGAEAAVVARGVHILGAASTRGTGGGINSSPIFEAVLQYKAVQDMGEKLAPNEEVSIVSTAFPCLDEFRLLWSSGIRVVCHIEEANDERAVRFLNKLSKNNPEDGFKIIQLKITQQL